MHRSCRTFLLSGLAALALALFPAPEVQAQGKKDVSKGVEFRTNDGVTIKGTLWPNSSGKRDAVVMLLHHFDPTSGGNRSQDNWPVLAQMLYDDGYSVLSFDFRGFGESKEVGKEFWDTRTFPHNGAPYLKNVGKRPESIDYKKNFNAAYYPYLVWDIAAAKAFLDRRNDAKELNTSNVILIGAGQGATLGAMWAYGECFRHKDKNPNPGIGLPQLGEAESKDIACCVWLTIDQSIVRRGVPLRRWLVEAGKNKKVGQLFVFGKDDSSADTYARNLVKEIKEKNKDLSVGLRAIEGSKLKGSKLIDKNTGKIILKDLNTIMEGRSSKEHVERKAEAAPYFYQFQPKMLILNKKAGAEAPPVAVDRFLR